MLKEKDFFLSQNEDEQGNGFYSRTLNTYYGKLNLKIPRIRYAHSFRPALLPPRWKRFNKEYEEKLVKANPKELYMFYTKLKTAQNEEEGGLLWKTLSTMWQREIPAMLRR